MKAVIISGLLYNLSDNIIPFLDKHTDVYVHTWDVKDNSRWIIKLNRYKKYCRTINTTVEPIKYEKKLYSYFYSTWKVINTIDNIDQYTSIIKFKPNLDDTTIQYKGNLESYFHKAYIQSRPLLEGTTKEECLYGSIYYQTLDERIFSGYPLAFKRIFHILYKDLLSSMLQLDDRLVNLYGKNYEGSIFWKEWFENRGIKLIQDLDLKIPNNKQL
jgi:hypothetical protein